MIWTTPVWDVPVDVGRDEAREAAARELSDPAYAAARPSLFDRILRWIGDRLGEVFSGVGSLGTGGVAGLVVLVLLIVLAVIAIRLRVGKVARTTRAVSGVFAGQVLAAADHRRAADAAAARGDFGEAVLERFRAVVRELEERGVVDEVSGRTVDEIARAASSVLPGSADSLRVAATIFDDVLYGGRPATVDGYRHLVALDDEVRTTRVVLAGARR